jgi:Uma2 family endonuclease
MASAEVIVDRIGVASWAALPDDVPGELVSGRVVEEEMPDLVHEVVVTWIIAVLRAWGASRGAIVAGSELKFVLGPGLGRKPDASMFLAGEPRPPVRGAVAVPPHLMVEVVSLAARDVRRDRIEKPSEYAAFGVRKLWLIDPEARTFEGWELGETGHYVRVLAATSGRLAVPALDGLTLDLDELWADVDRLG